MSIDPPKRDSDYSPEHAAELDRMVGIAASADVSNLNTAQLHGPLIALIEVCNSAMLIAYKHHYQNQPEPYPGACQKVLEQAYALVEGARKSGLLS